MKFSKIWRTCSWVYSGHKSSCMSNEACVIPLPETFYFNDALQNWNKRLLVEWRKLHHLNVVAAISQWHRHLSACVRAHNILSAFCGVFMVQCVKLMLRIFAFGVLLFDCFVYCQNVTCLNLLPGTVYALCRWGGRHSHRHTRSASNCSI